MNPSDPYSNCLLCPRRCGVNRRSGETGICGETDQLRLATAGLHFGEEPPLTGKGGSGTIFLSGCSMKCPLCQNHQISRGGFGRVVSSVEFTEICMRLQNAGAENLNLVTPSHMAPTLAAYLTVARGKGIVIPVAWNSSGYESMESIHMVKDVVDIWLPDLKTLSDEVALRIYGVGGFAEMRYAETASSALLAMADFGAPELDDEGRMRRGLMVRHLVLPGEMDSTREVLSWFAQNLKGRAWLSLMTQYTPVFIPGESRSIPNRQLNEEEAEEILAMLQDSDIDDGFVQELVPGNEWLPDFRESNPFSSELSRILWRWDRGFL